MKLRPVKGTTYGGAMPVTTKKPKPVTVYPKINLSSGDVPEVEGWEVGGVYTVVIKVKMLSKSKGEVDIFPTESSESRAKDTECRFEIREAGVYEESDADEGLEEQTARMLSGK